MAERITADICVVGGGSGGLSVAAGASQMGARTVLIEGGKMGGDCLNYGCVPSKSMIAAGHAAHNFARAGLFGVSGSRPSVDFGQVNDHVHDVIAGIAPHDSVERFEGLGVRVLQHYGRFLSPTEMEAGGVTVQARRFIVATGSSATVPPIDGIAEVPHFTNETIFDNREIPKHLIVIGGGPIGMELAQAHRRLGSAVTVLEMFKAMGRDDPELADIVKSEIRAEGVEILEGIKILRVRAATEGIVVAIDRDGAEQAVAGSHLLVAAGRKANVENLNLEAAGIDYTPKGITVDARLRTTNKKVFAIGDVAGGYQFTHVAGYHAGIVIRNALFRLPAKADHSTVPWVTYTDPELANVGLSEAEAEKQHDGIRVLRFDFAENDRARAERSTTGMIKAVTNKRGRILGAGIAGPHAGELILPWVLAMSQKLKIGSLANVIVPYPTLGEVSKRAAGSYYTPSLFSPKTRSIVRFLSRFG